MVQFGVNLTSQFSANSDTLMKEGDGDTVCHANAATPEDLDWIFRLEIDAYSAQYAVARRTLEQWYCRNPDGFSILTMNGRKIGHLTIVPLRPTILERFVQGTIAEQDIQADSLYTPGEQHLIRNLYCESIIIDSPKGHSTCQSRLSRAWRATLFH